MTAEQKFEPYGRLPAGGLNGDHFLALMRRAESAVEAEKPTRLLEQAESPDH